jgi:hypothetical protein
MSSRYSPLLRCAIALAQTERQFAKEGTVLSLSLPLASGTFDSAIVRATVIDLPLAPIPNLIAP